MSRSTALALVAAVTLTLLGCVSSSPQQRNQAQTSYRPAPATQDAAAMDQALDELLDEMSPDQLAALLAPSQAAPAAPPPADLQAQAQAQAIVESLTPEQRANLLQQLLQSP
jgi:hypothetical protein